MHSLTIAVPTWNRAAKLDACLARLAKWATRYPWLHIRVHDNASEDNTADIVKKWDGLLGRDFAYLRHAENRGLVGNFISCLERSQSEFVWVIGDDDVIKSHAIDMVLAELQAHASAGLVALNYRPIDGLSGMPMAEAVYSAGMSVRFPSSRDCFEACFREHYGSLMFITACVFNREHALVAMHEYDSPSDDLAFPFYAAGVCAAKGAVRVIDEVMFDGIYNVGSWKPQSFSVFHEKLPRVLVKLIKSHRYGKGLLQPHFARFPGTLYKPSPYLLKHPKMWFRALKTFRYLVSFYRDHS